MAGPFLFGQAGNQVNLLGNSGFGGWSNSEDLYTTAGTVPMLGDTYSHDTETCNDDAGDDESADWSETGGGAIAYVASTHYTFTGSGANEYVHSAGDFAALTAGKLYELTISFADAADAQTIQLGTFTTGGGATGFTALGADITTTGSEVAASRIFKAVGDETRLGFKVISDSSGANFVLWTDSWLGEVTPGITSGTAGPDGWTKTATFDVYREYLGTNTKDGSFYSLKLKKGVDTYEYFYFRADLSNQPEYYTRFRGRTVTLGAWVKTDVSTNTRLALNDDITGNTSSSYHPGDDAWHWLEVTATVASAATEVNIRIDCIANTGDITYISQPMLIFGSSIGEGNYVQPPGEIIWLENVDWLTDYNNASLAVDATINLEAQSNGIIPKGTIAVQYKFIGVGDAATSICYVVSETTLQGAGIQGFDGTNPTRVTEWVKCNETGDIYYNDTTGTWDSVYIGILAIQVAP